jgi:hypothetical protein
MKKFGTLPVLLFFLLAACSPQTQPSTAIPAAVVQSTAQQPSPSPSPTIIPSLSPTPTVTLTASPSPTPSPSPSPTATPPGGGSGVVLVESCRDWYDCDSLELSLQNNQAVAASHLHLKIVQSDQEQYKRRLDVVDPTTAQTKTILDCTGEFVSCDPLILTGSLGEDTLYVALRYQRQQYDGNSLIDIYRIDAKSYEAEVIDHFGGYIDQFHVLPGRSQGLLSTRGNDRYGELLLYDPVTLERTLVLRRKGQFLITGLTPQPGLFWFRRTDFCETELITSDGVRAARIMNSDGVIGWLDDENFLVFASDNNPPYCTHNGIAVANRIGLTGSWVTAARTDWAMLSPDRERIFYTTNCNNLGCLRLMSTDLSAAEHAIVIESTERFSRFEVNAGYSPDGTKILFGTGKQIWMFNADGSDAQMLLESDQMLHIIEWIEP